MCLFIGRSTESEIDPPIPPAVMRKAGTNTQTDQDERLVPIPEEVVPIPEEVAEEGALNEAEHLDSSENNGHLDNLEESLEEPGQPQKGTGKIRNFTAQQSKYSRYN